MNNRVDDDTTADPLGYNTMSDHQRAQLHQNHQAQFPSTPVPPASVTSPHASSIGLPDEGRSIHTADDIKGLLKEKLPKDQSGSVYRPYIHSEEDFHRQLGLYTDLNSRLPGPSDDFPTNNEKIQVLAQELTDAMTNMTGVVEAGKKSVARLQQLSPYELTLKSWQLIFDLRDVQKGQVSMQAWGGAWDGEDFDSYMERYHDLREKLRLSKSLVASLFDQPFAIRVCLNPSAEYKKKIANLKNNSRRAMELAEVRAAKRRALDSEEGEEADQAPVRNAGQGQHRQSAIDNPQADEQTPGAATLFTNPDVAHSRGVSSALSTIGTPVSDSSTSARAATSPLALGSAADMFSPFHGPLSRPSPAGTSSQVEPSSAPLTFSGGLNGYDYITARDFVVDPENEDPAY